MSLEIERRFIVKGKNWKNIASNPQHFQQGYLTSSLEGWTIRIRIEGKKQAWLTLKTHATGISNHEFEYSIPIDDAYSIWKLVQYKLTKIRYELNLVGGNWIVDCFEKENAPLVIAEVELSSESDPVLKPKWCGREITGEKQFSNAALAQNPFSKWPEQKRLALNLN